MRLKSLTFEDKRTGWKLEDLRLDSFNLLVGASGVGKTRILRAIMAITRISQGSRNPRIDEGMRFDVRFEKDGQDYTWQFDSTLPVGPREGTTVPPEENIASVLTERLSSANEETALVDRDSHQFLFRNDKLPMLSRAISALLLFDDPTIKRIRHAFTEEILDTSTWEFRAAELRMRDVREWISNVFPTFESLTANISTYPILKAFALQEKFPDRFDDFKQRFFEIFPTVEDVAVGIHQVGDASSSIPLDTLVFKIREHGVPFWIEASDISSGMNRTLHHLVDLMLAPRGAVVLIDEFENSLGANCMGPLTDLILSRATELQFIITSHHPYIINNIPKDYWKLVRRRASTVRVTPSSKIAALQGHSAQDGFIRLLNSPEFEEGLG